MRLKQTMKDHIVESTTRIICLGNNWMSPSLLKIARDDNVMKDVKNISRAEQEAFVAVLLETSAGRAALEGALKEVLTAYKGDKTVQFLTKKHIRNIIRLIGICEDAGTSTLDAVVIE